MSELPAVIEPGQLVVANVMTITQSTGVMVPPAWRGIIGRNAKQLFEDGFEPDLITAAALLAIKRGKPQLMQYIAGDLSLAAAGERMTETEYQAHLAVYGAASKSTLLDEVKARRVKREQEINERRSG